MIKRSFLIVFFGIILGTVMLSCDDGESNDNLYTLSSVVPDPTPVVLEDDLGVMLFDLSADPVNDEQADMFLYYLSDETITLRVANDGTGVGFNLSEGQLVEGTPSGDGEYSVSVSAAGDQARVAFWNEFMGHSVVLGENYTAYMTILANDHFTAEEFTSTISLE